MRLPRTSEFACRDAGRDAGTKSDWYLYLAVYDYFQNDERSPLRGAAACRTTLDTHTHAKQAGATHSRERDVKHTQLTLRLGARRDVEAKTYVEVKGRRPGETPHKTAVCRGHVWSAPMGSLTGTAAITRAGSKISTPIASSCTCSPTTATPPRDHRGTAQSGWSLGLLGAW